MKKFIIALGLLIASVPVAAQYYPGGSIRAHGHAGSADGGSITNLTILGVSSAPVAYFGAIKSSPTFSGDITITGSVLGDTNFTGAASTTTFAGWIDIGISSVTTARTGGDASCTAPCPAGYTIITGGHHVPGGFVTNRFIWSNYPVYSVDGTTGWYIDFGAGPDRTPWYCYAICGRFKRN
jgi:hypothetical protein